MATPPRKCTSCGADAPANVLSGLVKCAFCGATFQVGEPAAPAAPQQPQVVVVQVQAPGAPAAPAPAPAPAPYRPPAVQRPAYSAPRGYTPPRRYAPPPVARRKGGGCLKTLLLLVVLGVLLTVVGACALFFLVPGAVQFQTSGTSSPATLESPGYPQQQPAGVVPTEQPAPDPSAEPAPE